MKRIVHIEVFDEHQPDSDGQYGDVWGLWSEHAREAHEYSDAAGPKYALRSLHESLVNTLGLGEDDELHLHIQPQKDT